MKKRDFLLENLFFSLAAHANPLSQGRFSNLVGNKELLIEALNEF
jgi:hypothetical protein